MNLLSTRVAQRLLALFFLSASLAVAQPEPDMAAAREAATQAMAKMQGGSWQECEAASQSINQLATSKDKADTDLSEKLMSLCAAAIERGFNDLPAPPEQERLLTHAGAFVKSLLSNPTAIHRQHAEAIVKAAEKALPDDLRVRMLRLRLVMADKNRTEQIKLSAALMAEQDLDQGVREWVWDVYVSGLLRGKPSAEHMKLAEAVLTPWLEQKPQPHRARMLLLELHDKRKDGPAQMALATELLAEDNLSDSDREWVHRQRIEGSLKAGKTHELNEQDWNFMLEQITGSSRLKQFIDKYGQLMLVIAFGMGWLWLFVVAWITRSMRAKPPGFWMVVLWTTVVLYASSVIMAPLAICVTFSVLGVLILIFATTGKKTPLGYLVSPQAVDGSGKAGWLGIVGRCFLAFLLIQGFTQSYAWAFEQVMGRSLESQLVARLLHTDTLPSLAGMVFAGGIFVPFLEEVVFRGILQDWVGRWLPRGWCVVLVSILFGLVHGLEMAIPIAFIGMLLSMLRLRYRSLWPAILLHSLNNSVAIIALYFVPDTML